MTSGAMFVMLSRTPTLLEQLNFPSACCHEYHTKSRANATILLKPLALATTCSVAHERARKSASRSIPPGVTAWTLEIPMAQCVPRKNRSPQRGRKGPQTAPRRPARNSSFALRPGGRSGRRPFRLPRRSLSGAPVAHDGHSAAQGGDRLDCHAPRV